jgi:arylsulfatase A-like enzyme
MLRSSLALVAALLLGCAAEPPARLIRLGELLPAPAGVERELAREVDLGAEPQVVARDLEAAATGRLKLEVSGTASRLVVSWRNQGDPRYLPFRQVTLPLTPDGSRQTLELDLSREAYWVGRVLGLRLAVEGGAARLHVASGSPAPSPLREMALKGQSMPAFPAEERIEIPLPEAARRAGRLRLALGLVPELDKPGVTVHFTAAIESSRGTMPVLDEEVLGGAGRGWLPVTREIDLPRGGRLVLSAQAERRGQPLPAGTGFWGNPILTTGAANRAGKNLVVVLVDTLRADAVGAWGERSGSTPHLDRLAGESLRLSELYAPAPWTLPSVVSLLTGLQPQRHGAGQRVGGFAPSGLGEEARTLAEVLAGADFVTSGIYNNIYVNPAFGTSQGFDSWTWLERPDAEIAERAVGELRALADERFFLYIHLFDPHNPYEPRPEDCAAVAVPAAPGYRGPLGCFADRRPGLPQPAVQERPWVRGLYQAEVAAADRAVGRIVAALAELGLAEDTVLLVVSDHGEDLWDRMPQLRAGAYRPDADHGHSLYRELLHVPALLRVPGRDAEALSGLAETVDLFPTVLAALGVPAPPTDGQNLLAAAEPALRERRVMIAGALLQGPERWSIRRGGWKLVVPLDSSLPAELYDLSSDPGEATNVAAAHPDVARGLGELGRRELAARRKVALGRAGGTYLEWNHITKLRSLGYLQ